MIEKWKKWVLKMNLKRAALIFVVSSVVLILVLLAAMHGVFEREMFCWESVIVFLTICGIIGTILAIWYWILCLICVCRSPAIWGQIILYGFWQLYSFILLQSQHFMHMLLLWEPVRIVEKSSMEKKNTATDAEQR